MMKSYALVVETLDVYPSLTLDFRSDTTGDKNLPSCRNPESTSSNLAARLKERGARLPRDIFVESYVFLDSSSSSEPGPAMASSSAASDGLPEISNSALQRRPSDRREASVVSDSGWREKSGGGGDGSKETTPSESSSRSRNRSSKELSPGEQDRLHFISGNPFVEVTKGVIHLFKDTAGPTPATTTTKDQQPLQQQQQQQQQEPPLFFPDTEMMCIFGVPAKHKTPDLLQFTAPCHADLEYMRIIHDGSPNQYMVLLKFRSAAAGREFYAAYNRLPYNTMEPEVCCVLPVAWVEHCKESEYYPVGEAGTELPYCTICLERMDESVSTVLTILCNHKFHSGCLAQWEDPTCPVCRHVQTPEVVTEHLCSDCQSCSDLWICLVCGYVGCGRYAGGHAHKHFLDTQHCYSMELGHNRVWDYVGDNFVHRLVQNTSDGKLVEQEAGGGEEGKQRSSVGGLHVDNDEKMDSLQLEYTYLLTSQLESQRAYFESKLCRVEEEAGREIAQLTARAKAAQDQTDQLHQDLEVLVREKTKAELKVSSLVGRVGKLTTELEDERQLNASLRQNQEDWQIRLKRTETELNVLKHQKDDEIRELKEQVRDLMFYLEAQGKVAESPLKEEIQGGSIVVGQPAETPQRPSKGARKRKS